MTHKMISKRDVGSCDLNRFEDEFMTSLHKQAVTIDQAISLRIIKISVYDYLFFGLGNNGITPERFLEAYLYLFKVRGQDANTWDVHHISKSNKVVSPNEIKAKCFDTHYDIAGISKKMEIETFLDKLKARRQKIIHGNLKQITTHLSQYRAQEWKRLPKRRRKGKYSFPRVNVVSTLISPVDGSSLAKLYLFGRTPKTHQIRIDINALKYKRLLF